MTTVTPAITASNGWDWASARDLADAFWLAAQITADVPKEEPPSAVSAKPAGLPISATVPPPTAPLAIGTDLESRRSPRTGNDDPLHLSRPGSDPRTAVRPVPIPVPSSVPAVPAVVKALRPLIARRPSRIRSVLDHTATVRRYAQDRVLDPVFLPESVRCVNLALVLDKGPSMDVWGPTLTQLRGIFGRLPGFKRVRVCHLSTDGPEPKLWPASRLPVQRAALAATARSRAAEVLDPGEPNVVLVVTDCVSEAWHRPGMSRLLKAWADAASVSLVQMLPSRLWPRTALGGFYLGHPPLTGWKTPLVGTGTGREPASRGRTGRCRRS